MPLKPKKLGNRLITATVGGLLLGAFFFLLPKWCLHLFLTVFGILGVFEFNRITQGFGYRLYKIPAIFAIIYGMLTLYVPLLHLSWLPYCVIMMGTMLSLVPPTDMKKTLPQVGISLIAAAYLTLPLVSLAYVFNIEHQSDPNMGRYLIAFCVFMVWAGDSCAYLIGSLIGKTKIAPIISPNKTFEGTAANLLGNAAAAYVAKVTFLPQLGLYDIAFLMLIFGLLGFFGDLVESTWKRGSNIKDSGALFGGHGGVLDRIDSIFLTAPIFFFYIKHLVLDHPIL